MTKEGRPIPLSELEQIKVNRERRMAQGVRLLHRIGNGQVQPTNIDNRFRIGSLKANISSKIGVVSIEIDQLETQITNHEDVLVNSAKAHLDEVAKRKIQLDQIVGFVAKGFLENKDMEKSKEEFNALTRKPEADEKLRRGIELLKKREEEAKKTDEGHKAPTPAKTPEAASKAPEGESQPLSVSEAAALALEISGRIKTEIQFNSHPTFIFEIPKDIILACNQLMKKFRDAGKKVASKEFLRIRKDALIKLQSIITDENIDQALKSCGDNAPLKDLLTWLYLENDDAMRGAIINFLQEEPSTQWKVNPGLSVSDYKRTVKLDEGKDKKGELSKPSTAPTPEISADTKPTVTPIVAPPIVPFPTLSRSSDIFVANTPVKKDNDTEDISTKVFSILDGVTKKTTKPIARSLLHHVFPHLNRKFVDWAIDKGYVSVSRPGNGQSQLSPASIALLTYMDENDTRKNPQTKRSHIKQLGKMLDEEFDRRKIAARHRSH